MESLAALFIFTVLMAVIAMLIITALKISSDSLGKADIQQEIVNDIIRERYSQNPTHPVLTLTDNQGGIDVRIPIKVTEENGLFAFAPEEMP